MKNRHVDPTDTREHLRRGGHEELAVSVEQFKAIVVWVTERVLEQSFDPRGRSGVSAPSA